MARRRGKAHNRKDHKDLIREPNGRISRSQAGKKALAKAQHYWDQMTEQEALSVGLEARTRVLGVPEHMARDQRSTTVIGRLAMGALHTKKDGSPFIDRDQYDAAEWYLLLSNAYLCAQEAEGAYWDKHKQGGSDPDAHENFCLAIKERFENVREAIQQAQNESRSSNLYAALEMFLFRDHFMPHLLNDLLISLNAIHKVRNGMLKRRRAA